MKFIKFSFWMSAFTSLVMFGMNFSFPDKQTLLRPFMSRQRAQPPVRQTAVAAQPTQPQGKRYVFIEGKRYEYNSRNTYYINGVPTYYKPSRIESEPESAPADEANLQAHVQKAATENLQKVQKMVEQGPLSAYGPGGMRAIMDAAQEAKGKMEERNNALNTLMNE